MTIVITCGHQFSDLERVQDKLIVAGLQQANSYGEECCSPADLTSNICLAHKIDFEISATIRQLELDPVWHTKCANLVSANNQYAYWGWADSNSVCLLNHWRDFDQQIKFILVYSSPEYALARMFEQVAPSLGVLENALKVWEKVNTELLRFYNATRSRALLVNVSSANDPSNNVANRIRESFNLDLHGLTDVESAQVEDSSIASLMASALVEEAVDAQSLYLEMESSSDLPGPGVQSNQASVYAAWRQYAVIRDQSSAGICEPHTKIDELTEENEELISQLHQVQEELEHYFLKYQECAKSSRYSTHQQKTDIQIDMCHHIDGDNWYDTEYIGRWAGPGTSSMLRLPAIPKGNYKLEIVVVDAMSPEIIRDMEVIFNQKQLKLKGLKGLAGKWSPLVRLITKKQRYPITLTGRVRVEENDENKTSTLLLNFPNTISPSSRGSLDTRDLAVCFRSIRVT